MLKKYVITLTLMVGFTVFAQHYTFDYLITSKQRTVSKKFELSHGSKRTTMRGLRNSHLINSENPEYYLFLTYDAYTYDDKKGNFNDVTDKLNNSFRMYPSLLEKEIGFGLRYPETVYNKDNNDFAKHIMVRKIKELVYEITADISESKKHKLTVVLKESPDDLIHSVRLEMPFEIQLKMLSELKKNLNPNKNYFISEYVSHYIPGPRLHVRTAAQKLKIPLEANIMDKKH